MADLSQEERVELERLLAKATRGRWEAFKAGKDHGVRAKWTAEDGTRYTAFPAMMLAAGGESNQANAELVAAAVNALPRLLASARVEGACEGCGSTKSLEELRAAGHVSCCPERKMLTASQWRDRAEALSSEPIQAGWREKVAELVFANSIGVRDPEKVADKWRWCKRLMDNPREPDGRLATRAYETTDAILSQLPSGGGAPDGWRVAQEIAAERRRQVEQEGWSPEHDDEHADGEMARAAACYAVSGGDTEDRRGKDDRLLACIQYIWPQNWAWRWWKPKDRRRDLVRAGALIIAEIERLDRAGRVDADAPHQAREEG